jgi:hypothetical protein
MTVFMGMIALFLCSPVYIFTRKFPYQNFVYQMCIIITTGHSNVSVSSTGEPEGKERSFNMK